MRIFLSGNFGKDQRLRELSIWENRTLRKERTFWKHVQSQIGEREKISSKKS